MKFQDAKEEVEHITQTWFVKATQIKSWKTLDDLIEEIMTADIFQEKLKEIKNRRRN